MDESLTGDGLALTMYFLRKAKEMRGRVLVFIDGVTEDEAALRSEIQANR